MGYSYVDITRTSVSDDKIINAGIEYRKAYPEDDTTKEICYVMSNETFNELLAVSDRAKINPANLCVFVVS